MQNIAQMSKDGDLAGVRAALARGEDVNLKDSRNSTGLMWAAYEMHNAIVSLLLDQPTVDLNCCDSNGETALIYAIAAPQRDKNIKREIDYHAVEEYGNVEAVRLLLADPRLTTQNQRLHNGWTPAMFAIVNSAKDSLRVLVAHPSVDLKARDSMGRSLQGIARCVTQRIDY